MLLGAVCKHDLESSFPGLKKKGPGDLFSSWECSRTFYSQLKYFFTYFLYASICDVI